MPRRPVLPMQKFSFTRAALVLVTICCLLIALMGRVAYLQTIGRQQTLGRAERQQHQTQALIARRGSIYDINGLELAGTVQTRTLFVDPKFMYEVFRQDGHSQVEMDDAIHRLSIILDKDAFELTQQLSDRSTSRFLKIAENLDDTTCTEILKLNLPGVGLQPTNVRYYPMGSIAAHVLGSMGKDGHGLEGVEMKFEKLLAGHDGYERTLKDARHRAISIAAEDYLPPQHGQHLVLTIDSNIQLIAEQELAGACEKYKAKRGEVIVMDPHSGEVLALANWPTFNPQNIEDSTEDLRRNRALTDPYEPGSTIKPFVAGPALEWKVTRINEIWPIPGIRYKTPYGRTITDVHGYGPLSTWDGLVKSSNILMSMLGERMGNPQLHRALASWGYGRATGIELPGEAPGKLNPLRQWTKYSTESVSQGYELMVTPLQICRAFCVYGNGGYLVHPTIVKGVLDSEGHTVSHQKPTDPKEMPRVLDESTVLEMRRILCDVVVRGTATGARSQTWNIFGKTGTAHISQGRSGYSQSKFNSSFICAAPAEDPRLVVAFIVHEPERSLAHYGGTVSAPGASHLVERALGYLQVPASPDLPLPPSGVQNLLVNFNPKAYIRHPAETADARE